MRFRRLLFLIYAALALGPPLFSQVSGSITSTQCVSIGVEVASTVGIQVTGTWTGTLSPKISIQGQAAQTIQVFPYSSSTAQTSITANGAFQAKVAGGSTFQVCGNTVTSGTTKVFLNTSQGVAVITSNGSISGSGLILTSSGTPAPSPLATSACPTGEGVWMYGLNGSSQYQDLASWDTAGSPPTPAGQISWCRPFVYNDSGTSIHPNRAVTLFHYGGNGGLTNDTAHDDTTLFSSFQNAGAGQNFHQAGAYYGETILTGNPTFGAHAGGERSAFGMRLNLTDLRTNAVTLSGNGFAVYSGQFEKQTTSAEPSKHGVFDGTFSNEAGGNQGNQNAFVFRGFCENVSGSPTNYSCSAFEITAPTPSFPTQNIGLLVNGTWPTGSLDFPIEVSGDSTHGHVYLGGPSKIGGALAHPAASTILELGGATGSWAGFAHIRMDGSTSGNCNLSTDATATAITSTCPISGTSASLSTGITSYAGITTAGFGLPVQVARVRAVSQVAAIGTTTLLTTGANTADYLVVATLYCDTTSAAATASITISYTDSGSQAQSISPSSAACTTLGSSSFALINSPITAKNATNITYATSIVNTPTYDLRLNLYQLGSN